MEKLTVIPRSQSKLNLSYLGSKLNWLTPQVEILKLNSNVEFGTKMFSIILETETQVKYINQIMILPIIYTKTNILILYFCITNIYTYFLYLNVLKGKSPLMHFTSSTRGSIQCTRKCLVQKYGNFGAGPKFVTTVAWEQDKVILSCSVTDFLSIERVSCSDLLH